MAVRSALDLFNKNHRLAIDRRRKKILDDAPYVGRCLPGLHGLRRDA